MAELWGLKLTVSIAKPLGQFFVKDEHLDKTEDKSGILETFQQNSSKFWTGFVSAFHLMCAQTLLVDRWELLKVQSGKLKLQIIISEMATLIFVLGTYLFAIIWLTYASKYSTLWRKIKSYDDEFNVKIELTKTQQFKSIFLMFCGVMEFALITLLFREYVNYTILNLPSYGIKPSGWLHRIFQDNSCIPWIVGVGMGVCNNTSGNAINFIVLLTQGLCTRISRVKENLRDRAKIFKETGFLKKTTVLENLRTSKFVEPEVVTAHVIELSSIFEDLQIATGVSILAYIAFGTSSSAIFLVVIGYAVGNPDGLIILVGGGICLCDIIVRLVLLADCGENLNNEVSSLRRVVMEISPVQCWNPGSLVDLKLLVASLKFSLTGCGYFKLNRDLLTSIGGALVTYSIILIQLN